MWAATQTSAELEAAIAGQAARLGVVGPLYTSDAADEGDSVDFGGRRTMVIQVLLLLHFTCHVLPL